MPETENNSLEAMRHSLAHIMASAVLKQWPEAKLGIGPVVENGFYYDIDIPGVTISEEDFATIETAMNKIIKADEEFIQSDVPIKDAVEWANSSGQNYKLELLNDLQRAGTTVAKDLSPEELGTLAEGPKNNSSIDNVSFYTNGDFKDLCRGPHLKSTGKVGAFKLMRIAGAYWRGKEDNPQMQRLYGVAFTTEKELNDYLRRLEEAEKRDHRRLGRELDLYTLSELVGAGLPLFTPRGTVLRELLGRYSQQLREEVGFERVWTPHITKTDLYKKSGHWDKFGDELFLVNSQETSDEFVMKPMNCPHHSQIYNSTPRSYKDLPIKYMENATDYRDEKSGEIHGISRVRAFTQDDSHVFCTPEQIEESVSQLVGVAKKFFNTLDMKLRFVLSFRDDSDNYLGEDAEWKDAQKKLENLANKNSLDYEIVEGEAAFYGPKIDYMATDSIGREWQLATVQLDFVQPKRLELEYIDKNGEAKTPLMIHCAVMGSLERFLSVYIEHVAGRFPFWLAPEQIRVLTVNDQVNEYVTEVEKLLYDIVLNEPLALNKLRITSDIRNESLSKKIKEAELLKIPVILIIGPKDKNAKEVSVRAQGNESKIKLDKLQGWVESFKG